MQHIEAVSATCTTAGNIEYYYCNTCHKYFSDEAGQSEITQEQTVVAATQHAMQHFEPVSATCTTAGNIEYYYCNTCHKYFSDEAGQNEITQEQTVVAATQHAMQHFEPVSATCTTAGNVEYYHCDKCGLNFKDEEGTTPVDNVVIPAGHKLTKVDAVPATCTTAGNIEYYYCNTCHKYFSDEAGQEEITQEETVVAATQHAMQHIDAVPATCTTAGNIEYYYCEACHKYFSDEAGQNEITQEQTVIAATQHAMQHFEAVSATCTTAGNVEYYHCDKCGLNFKDADGATQIEDVVIPAGHNLTKVDAVSATCTTAGNIEYYYCNTCHKYFSDEAGQEEITQEETVTEATGHVWAEAWTSDEAGHWHACTAAGCEERNDYAEHTYAPATTEAPETCTVCGHTRGEKLFFDKLADSFSTESNPNGNWTYGSVAYAWNGDQAIKNEAGSESFTFTAATDKTADSWKPAGGGEIKAGWLSADSTLTIAYTFTEAGTYNLHLWMNGKQEGSRFIVRTALVGEGQTSAKTTGFISGAENREWSNDSSLTVEAGDTVYIMIFNETKTEGSFPQADYDISFTEVRA